MIVAVITAIDLIYQRMQHMKEMRMSRQELKEEYKETEGDPLVKGRLRQLRMERTRRRMMAQVPQSDVVVTNPTHYAVALKYDPEKNLAPVVVAKGVDFIAEQIKKVAIANEVMILRAPPLARAIYYHTELEREIPQGLYIAVAQVLAYVFQLKRFHEGKGQNPGQQPEFPVPPDLQRG